MTEEEWFASCDLDALLAHLTSRTRHCPPNDRRLRLFAVACIRQARQPLADGRLREALEIVERFADARTNEERKQIKAARRIARDLFRTEHYVERGNYVVPTASECYLLDGLVRIDPGEAVEEVRYRCLAYERLLDRDTVAGDIARVWLLRDIVGNPFRPAAIDPAWRTTTAVQLAGRMYESREFSAMPILADALQDAGCDADDILAHCRNPDQVHVRGCWVVDLVLGKS